MCLRVKRGLDDTSINGGYYKDKVYFEGAIKILKNRKLIETDILYSGKISIDDLKRQDIQKYFFKVDKIRSKLDLESIKLPYFARNKEIYRKALDNIAKINGLD